MSSISTLDTYSILKFYNFLSFFNTNSIACVLVKSLNFFALLKTETIVLLYRILNST